ncbi:SinR family protein [Pseudonocardia hydrocarbonoxydans]|uniref:SinR family protein n=1 Tax=Pseudonocardia hydrocarbonoxydans TaxID=76726 RepID=A0A4Y3WZP2_9PSEU|nr:SinR family protein [Pseudonocardia hydrocarbonoxydans]GEC22926.1 hypothetical protein PHY01_52090 [Pseudonocardia hydrocarbonoxydans]
MSTMLISYDLNSPGQKYDELIKHIKSYGTWCHVLDSTWAVVTTRTASGVRDECLKHIDTSDDLHVVNITGQGSAWYGLSPQISAWLKKHT